MNDYFRPVTLTATIVACAIAGLVIGILSVVRNTAADEKVSVDSVGNGSRPDIDSASEREAAVDHADNIDCSFFELNYDKQALKYACRRWLPPAYNFKTHMRGGWATLHHDGTGRYARLHFKDDGIRINAYPYRIPPMLRWAGIVSIFLLFGWMAQSSNPLIILLLVIASYFSNAFILTWVKMASKRIWKQKVLDWQREVHGLLAEVVVKMQEEQEWIDKHQVA